MSVTHGRAQKTCTSHKQQSTINHYERKELSDTANEYHLVRKVNDLEFSGNTTFAEVGVEDGESITVVPRGKAG